jgi:hypothetical protein
VTQERHPLEISEEVARAAGVPDDLDATQREPYAIPTTARRRTSGIIYSVGGLLTAALVAAGLPTGLLAVAGLLVVIAGWHFVSAWQIEVLDPQALDTANRATEFSVGHASAAVGFDSWRARPIWNVLVFSADDPPTERGLVRVDAVDGHVVEMYAEEITDSV